MVLIAGSELFTGNCLLTIPLLEKEITVSQMLKNWVIVYKMCIRDSAGASIMDNLKENKKLGWTFVDEEEAIEGVKSGAYYAAIVIPEDFSDSLLSILSGDVRKPQLAYYITEKKNAIAPKITDTGATTLQQQINDTFSSVASEAISMCIRDSSRSM